MWSSARPTRSILRPRSIRRSASCSTSRADHLDRHGTHASTTPRSRSGWSPACSDGTAIVGVDDDWCAARSPTGSSAPASASMRISVRRPLPDGYLRRRRRRSCARPAARRDAGRATSAASARCAARTMRRTPPAPSPPALGARARRRRRSRRACASFPGLAHRMEQVGRKGAVLFVNDSKATNADCGGAGAGLLHATSSGSPAASRRTAASRRSRDFFPRIAQGLSDRRGGATISPATLGGQVPYEIAGTLDRGGRSSPRATPQRSTARGAGRAAVAGLRLVRPVPRISRCAATRFRELVLALPGRYVPSASSDALTLNHRAGLAGTRMPWSRARTHAVRATGGGRSTG